MSAAKVFVVDDDESVRAAVSSLIRSVGLRVETFVCAQDFLDQARHEGPCCAVLDVRMPGMSGLELQRELTRRGAAMPLIFITGHGDIAMSVGAMKAGAIEFLPKPFKDEDLLRAIEEAHERDAAAGVQRAERDAVRARYATLTAREKEVMALTIKGMLNKQIAIDLGIAETTIKVHRHNLMLKMQADSLPALVRMAALLA